MPSATASGADTGSGARSREHNQGNQERKYTPEQKAAVLRVRKCHATAYYEILCLEKTASDGEIKKAYRKLSLLTHPDKNGYDGADEAFKSMLYPSRHMQSKNSVTDGWKIVVSRAFQVLSDAEKKSRYDKFGGDPDSRFNPGASSGPPPFSGFSNGGFPRGNPAGSNVFEEEISPEELFNRFFNGGLGGMGGGFSPFGMNVISSLWAESLLTLAKEDLSLSSTWVEDLDSVCISLEVRGRGEGHGRPLLNQSQRHLDGRLCSNCFPCSCYLFFRFFRLFSPAPLLLPDLLIVLMLLCPPIQCSEPHRNLR